MLSQFDQFSPQGEPGQISRFRNHPLVLALSRDPDNLKEWRETVAGCSLAEIHSLYGPAAYRRYEKRALEETIKRFPQAVIATPGGIVSDPATFSLLLAQCYTVWVRATPEEHMGRVLAQGDTRPMAGHAGNREAMNDLRRILESRAAFYAKADEVFETSGRTIEQSFAALRAQLEPVTRIGGAERIA